MSISECLKYDFSFLPPLKESYSTNNLIVTIIIDCYYNLELVKLSIDSILSQDYKNIELMLIDNGAHNDVSDYLHYIYGSNNNTALVEFSENIFSWSDVNISVAVTWNAGLINSKGDILSHLSYDDLLSVDCVSRMVKLFDENKNCVTAAPLPVSINIKGLVNEELSRRLRSRNKRKRYMNGKDLALDFIQKNKGEYFAAPGDIMFIKKEVLINNGGFDRSHDDTQIIKFSIHGETGFDYKAKQFWRSHDKQLSQISWNKGVSWCDQLPTDVKNGKIIEMWASVFSSGDIVKFKRYLKRDLYNKSAELTVNLLYRKNFSAVFRVIVNTFKKCPKITPLIVYRVFYEIVRISLKKIL